MTYYEIEIQRNMEDVESKGMYSYETLDEAKAVFHTKMASGITAGRQGNLKYVMNLIVNDLGNTEVVERWVAPAPEPEPEPEEEPSEPVEE